MSPAVDNPPRDKHGPADMRRDPAAGDIRERQQGAAPAAAAARAAARRAHLRHAEAQQMNPVERISQGARILLVVFFCSQGLTGITGVVLNC